MADWYEPDDPTPREQCPCCGYVSLPERGTSMICPVCWWEDDSCVGDDFAIYSMCNHSTLAEGRANYARFGLADPRMLDRVHPTIRPAFEHRPLPTDGEIIARRPRTYFAVQFIAVFEPPDDELAFPIDIQQGPGVVMGRSPAEFSYDNDLIRFDTMTLRLADDRIVVTCDANERVRDAAFVVGENAWVRVMTRTSEEVSVSIGLFVGWPATDTFLGTPPAIYDLRRAT